MTHMKLGFWFSSTLFFDSRCFVYNTSNRSESGCIIYKQTRFQNNDKSRTLKKQPKNNNVLIVTNKTIYQVKFDGTQRY